LGDEEEKLRRIRFCPCRGCGTLHTHFSHVRQSLHEDRAFLQFIRSSIGKPETISLFIKLTDYYHRLRAWKERYFPKSPDEEPNPRSTEAAQSITQVEYVLDCFLSGEMAERIEIMSDLWEKVKKVEGDSQGSFRTADDGTGETDPEEWPGFAER